MPGTFKGLSAEIRWGYHLAAALGPWTIEADVLTASVTSSSSFRLAQHPLIFAVRRPVSEWTWTVAHDTLVLNGQDLTARLLPQE